MVQLCPERVSKIWFAGSWNQTKKWVEGKLNEPFFFFLCQIFAIFDN